MLLQSPEWIYMQTPQFELLNQVVNGGQEVKDMIDKDLLKEVRRLV
jgi:hypothetical protein